MVNVIYFFSLHLRQFEDVVVMEAMYMYNNSVIYPGIVHLFSMYGALRL